MKKIGLVGGLGPASTVECYLGKEQYDHLSATDTRPHGGRARVLAHHIGRPSAQRRRGQLGGIAVNRSVIWGILFALGLILILMQYEISRYIADNTAVFAAG